MQDFCSARKAAPGQRVPFQRGKMDDDEDDFDGWEDGMETGVWF